MKHLLLFILILYILFIVALESKEKGKPKKSKKNKSISEMKSPITVSGRVWARKNCMFGEILSKGGIEAKNLKTKKLEAQVLKTKLLKVGTLKSKKEGRPLVINGSISVYKMKTQEKKQKVLLQEIQWELLHHLDFNDQSNSKCENLRDGHFFGGYCEHTNQTLSKKFNTLPQHTQIKVELALHVFDQWESEQIIMRADEQIIWKNKFENTVHHNNFCGSSRFGDQINIPIMKIFDHTHNELNLQVQGLTSKSTCEASFGIDNLVIYYR
ncbi:unnamed protein product [Paramecium primaurelia]|uniref:Uncharacterized protein n=1 Tax=Paramecium primaurelia TaxID=5886 RepID=A0A8S1Q1L2_PARPR|nr:unnamed protein product [Paramecium primaurelia]